MFVGWKTIIHVAEWSMYKYVQSVVPRPQKDEGATLGPTIKKHIIQVSTHQMSVLMLFNKRTNLSFQVCTIIDFPVEHLRKTQLHVQCM